MDIIKVFGTNVRKYRQRIADALDIEPYLLFIENQETKNHL